MVGLHCTLEHVAAFSRRSLEDLNPILKRILATCPDSYIFGIGGHSVVLRIADVAVKVALKPGDGRLRHEQKIFNLFSESRCPHIIQCYSWAADVTFLELLPRGALHDRITMAKPRPILHWMVQLSQAAAYLERLGYAHGDINPQNILLDDEDRLRLIDFDHSLKVGDDLEVGNEPYVRQFYEFVGGTFGIAGPFTEQFALGSVFWYMTRGSQLYSELQGHERVERLLDGIFPTIDPQDPIDRIIRNCWNVYYPSIADLVDDIQGVAGLEAQTQNTDTITPSRRQEMTLLCEEYCRRASLAPVSTETERNLVYYEDEGDNQILVGTSDVSTCA